MKKRFNKLSLIPIPFVCIMIGFLIFWPGSNDTINLFFLILIASGFFITIALLTSSDYYNTKKWFNANRIKNLESDIYGHYATITKQFTFRYDPSSENVIVVSETDKKRLENFVVMIVKHSKFLHLYKHRFETINHTDGMYYQLMHIYALYYLLENDVTKFQVHYKLYKDTISLRSESRVLNEKLYRIAFGQDYYDIPVYLLDTMFEYYVLDKPIDHEIMKFHPKCPLDEMIYITILYHYLKTTENQKMLSDIEDEFLRFKEIRKNL